ncbi:MAG: hypothetical protein A2086_15740 [Spirochaetes bacterium GWD1_27_9]|nr:MAG: hypothetical protein A2Z98_11010 [Spirochaetes bacterium GWB1_27_13]OHD27101.1 MAG: hypothetical protein A2Y34_11430 [Spirochaetes bacterium GWC1_27_15]OHD42833.1 MAG: hypothetical protein A2086_15740 [Spirochaetes bacterium GWD1_27_9]
MINITDSISISENDLSFTFVRSGGPGGQNVNKVSTTAELRFNIAECQSIPHFVKNRLMNIAKNKISKEGILFISGNEFRTQEQNKEAVIKRFVNLVKQAAILPKKRFHTKPTRSSVEKRLIEKKKLGGNKNQRNYSIFDE